MLEEVTVRGLQPQMLQSSPNEQIELKLACGDHEFLASVRFSDGWQLSLQSESEQVMLSIEGKFATVQEAIVAAMLQVQAESATHALHSGTGGAESSPMHSIGDLVKKTIAEAKDGYEHPERH